ncbi:MAG: protein-L-isoaspartate(D-aspartate) O-methyltransferase [Planctomycetales bacterium]|nr:protein-L-isoaspartate(D-aspartate) O-methyltransferase [Planctomycetales bacterium]
MEITPQAPTEVSFFHRQLFNKRAPVFSAARYHGAMPISHPDYEQTRRLMVEHQLAARDIVDPRVLDAMRRVPRHLFVDEPYRKAAYRDYPLPIGYDQTISQPYIVALMTQLARPTADAIALDVGTGCGYQAAVLGELVSDVYSIEIIEPLAERATRRLAEMGYSNVHVQRGDGHRGWPEHAPYDFILAAAAPGHVPPALEEQLKPGGRLVIPVGEGYQELLLIEKRPDGQLAQRSISPVAFVPMTGRE